MVIFIVVDIDLFWINCIQDDDEDSGSESDSRGDSESEEDNLATFLDSG